jgi:hypothetical protein
LTRRRFACPAGPGDNQQRQLAKGVLVSAHRANRIGAIWLDDFVYPVFAAVVADIEHSFAFILL